MKKSYFLICFILLIVVLIVFVNLKNVQKVQREAEKFNQIYEEYNTDKLNGLDVTTVINKAINNNEKYNIEKDENGLYKEDNSYSIKIYIKMIINGKTYPMETINSKGMSSFIENFSTVDFKCSDIQYHKKTGRVSSITFEALEY